MDQFHYGRVNIISVAKEGVLSFRNVNANNFHSHVQDRLALLSSTDELEDLSFNLIVPMNIFHTLMALASDMFIVCGKTKFAPFSYLFSS